MTRTRKLCFVASTLMLALTLPQGQVDASEVRQRLVYGQGCDWPIEDVRFIDESGGSQLVLSHLPPLDGVRVSPAAPLLAASSWNGIVLLDYTSPRPELEVISERNGSVAWSANGKHLAYSGDGTWILTLGETPSNSKLTDIDGQIDWSPDGEHIVVASPRQPFDSDIYVIDVGDGTSQLIGHGDQPRWSPEGSRIVFVVNDVLATMRPDGTDVESLGVNGWAPAWSPDGGHIAFVSNDEESGYQFIGVLDVDTGEVTPWIQGDCGDDNFAIWDWERVHVPSFGDTDFGNTFYEDIEWLATEGITRGCNPPANDRYCPDDFVTRGQMAAFLHRALADALTPTQQIDFTDDDGNTFEADIGWLGGTGVSRGCNPPANDRYCPDDFVTRGQMAAFLHRALADALTPTQQIDFTDDDGNTFEADIEWLGGTGVSRGCNPPANDRYCPDDFVTRGQMAAFLHRALEG